MEDTQQVVYLYLSGVDRTLIAVIAAFAAGVFAYISNTLHWRRDKKFETFRALANQFIDMTNALQNDISTYWAQDYRAENVAELRVLEESIKSRIFSSYRLLTLILEEKGLRKESQFYAEHVELINKLYDAATGGDFEVAGRKYSKGVIATSNKLLLDMQHRVYNLGFKNTQLFRSKYQ